MSTVMHPSAAVSGDPLIIAGVEYHSRLLVGTGKYKDMEETRAATGASGAEIVTVAESLSAIVTVSLFATPIVMSPSPDVIVSSVTMTASSSSSSISFSALTSIAALVALAGIVTVPESVV